MDKVGRNIERENPLERLTHHRTRDDVAAEHNEVDARFTNLFEDRLERRQVRVNVAQRRHPHTSLTSLV